LWSLSNGRIRAVSHSLALSDRSHKPLGERLSISNELGVALIGAGAMLVAYKG